MENIKRESNKIIDEHDSEIILSILNKEKLIQKRLKIKEELEKIEEQIEDEIYNTITLCNFSEKGHQFIVERDPGPYGECWNVCTVCGYEF